MIKEALSKDDWKLIARYAVAGGGIGGAAALATSLVDYIRNMNRQYTEDSEDDDNTLYLRIKQDKKNPIAVKSASSKKDRNILVSGPAAITTGALSMLGGWALINSLYKKMMLNEAQKELDEAQNQYVDLSGYERLKKTAASKSESDTMGGWSNLLSAIVSVPGIFSLASGVVAYKALDKYFAKKKADPVTAPRKIKIVSPEVDFPAGDKQGPDYNTNGSEFAKKAGIESSDGVEFLIRSVCTARRPDSDISNIVGDVSLTGGSGFEKLASDIGFQNALDAVKGRTIYNNNMLKEQLAITHIAKSASIGEQAAITAAAEFAELYPSIYMSAVSLPEKSKDVLEKVACVLGKASRATIMINELGLDAESIEKQASMFVNNDQISGMIDMVKNIDEKLSDESDEEGDPEDRTNTSKEEAGLKKKNKPKYVSTTKTGLRLAKSIEDMDDIDKILNPDA